MPNSSSTPKSNGAATDLPLWLAFIALNEQATRDWLTGLHNRRYFEETLADQIEIAERYKRDLSLVLFDLDGFKSVNDTLGHAAGDEALRQFARVLKSTSRAADIVCRYGGDEFAVLLPETGKDDAWIFAERVFEAVAHGSNLSFSVSGGVAALPSKNLVATADEELFARKRERSMNR